MPYINYDYENKPVNFYSFYRLSDARKNTNFGSVTKFDCACSFKNNIGLDNCTLLADNCSSETIEKYTALGFKNIIQSSLGNAGSFLKVLELALNLQDDDIVYLCEDDYLYCEYAKSVLLEGINIADFVSLYDHSDKYGTNSPNPLVQHGGELVRVLLTNSCHWKETNSTTMTFATKVKTLREFKDIIPKYLESEIPKDYLMWREILFNKSLVTPMPGYSTHCQEPWITPLRKTWN